MAKQPTSGPFAAVLLDEASATPLYYQVYQRLRAAILLGQLAPGSRLPSTRQMAEDLDVSRNTLMSAFDQLIAEGYVEGRVGAGTFVSPTLPEELLEARLKTRRGVQVQSVQRGLSRRGQVLTQTSVTVAERPPGTMRPFISGIPALDEFPMTARRGLVLGYGAYNPRQIRAGVSKLAIALRAVARNPGNFPNRRVRALHE